MTKHLRTVLLAPIFVGALLLRLPLAALGATAPEAGDTNAAAANQTAEAPDTNTINAQTEESQDKASAKGRGGVNREAMVIIGKDAELKASDTAQVVVVIGGSAKIHGKVTESVTVIGGEADIDGDVADEVVAVMGGITLHKGARVGGDVVAVGGKVQQDEGATIGGHVQEVDLGAIGLPAPRWLQKWFRHCVLLVRPLSLSVGWVWVVAGVFLLFYLLVAAVMPRPVEACVAELQRRPATTFFLGLATMLLSAIVFVILFATVIGILLIPFFVAALFFAVVFGKIAVFESIGFNLGRAFSGDTVLRPLGACIIGAAVISLVYLIPLLGCLAFCLISVWALGIAAAAALGGIHKERPAKPASSSIPSPAPVPTPEFVPSPDPAMATAAPAPTAQPEPSFASGPSEAYQSSAFATSSGGVAVAEAPRTTTSAQPKVAPPVLPDELAYPKANFWARIAAGFLDLVLIAVLSGFAGAMLLGPAAFPLVSLAYFSGLWTWRGTTIGGIVVGLKVARVDGQQLTFAVALVRSLAAAFALMMFFLGFLWIIWDHDKQGWHDKIAGTVVLKLPKGIPLVCL